MDERIVCCPTNTRASTAPVYPRVHVHDWRMGECTPRGRHARRVGGCLTVRPWVEAINEDNLDNPIVPCTNIGFHPPAEGKGSAVFVVFEDTRPHMMFKNTFFLPATLRLVFNCFFFENVSQDCAFAESSTKDSRPTAVGVKRMDTGDLQVPLAVSSWRLGAGELWELASRSADKGLMVTVCLA